MRKKTKLDKNHELISIYEKEKTNINIDYYLWITNTYKAFSMQNVTFTNMLLV